jgi:hypothetical protein
MVDSTIQLLLEQTIDTSCKLHLVLLFHDNPQLRTSSRQIAERSCRDIWSVEQALQELVEGHVLSADKGINDVLYYRYTPSTDKLEAIRKLVLGYDDPFQRDWIQSSVRELERYAYYNRNYNLQQSAYVY